MNFIRQSYNPHPGKFLRRYINSIGMTQLELATRVQSSPKNINELINGKIELSDEMAFKLELVLGVSAQFWINLETSFRQELVRRELIESAKNTPISNYQYSWLAKFGFVKQTSIKKMKIEQLSRFFGTVSLPEYGKMITQQYAFRSKENFCPESMMVWLRVGDKISEPLLSQVSSHPTKSEIKQTFSTIKNITNKSPIDYLSFIQDELLKIGIIIVYIPYISKCGVRGVTKWINKKPVIYLSDHGKKLDGILFTLAHELGHIGLDHSKKKPFISYDYDNDIVSNIPEEQAADTFAQELILPQDEIDTLQKMTFFSHELNQIVQRLSSQYKTRPDLILGRLAYEKIIDWKNYQKSRETVTFEEMFKENIPPTPSKNIYQSTPK